MIGSKVSVLLFLEACNPLFPPWIVPVCLPCMTELKMSSLGGDEAKSSSGTNLNQVDLGMG